MNFLQNHSNNFEFVYKSMIVYNFCQNDMATWIHIDEF